MSESEERDKRCTTGRDPSSSRLLSCALCDVASFVMTERVPEHSHFSSSSLDGRNVTETRRRSHASCPHMKWRLDGSWLNPLLSLYDSCCLLQFFEFNQLWNGLKARALKVKCCWPFGIEPKALMRVEFQRFVQHSGNDCNLRLLALCTAPSGRCAVTTAKKRVPRPWNVCLT